MSNIKFIAVLNSDLRKEYWRAVQWSDSLVKIRANSYYTAGVNIRVPKDRSDNLLEVKWITEVITGKIGKATILQIGLQTQDALNIANI